MNSTDQGLIYTNQGVVCTYHTVIYEIKPLPHFEPTLAFHRLARDHGVNVIGATHYSTEKFACMAMTGYFAKAGVPAEFLEGTWYLEDL